ncbi:hemagglutinin repeat-containing protein, partial [Fusobacterium animalis]|uniref:hemagglutinin repeat-containing protein n=2 Tax=Fusobacterium TaxID=848 RepID=UPI003556926D
MDRKLFIQLLYNLKLTGVNLGFNKSSSESKSHNEFGVVTTIRGKDENSSITYNNVKNIEYVGTQAKDTKFIYNNVDNITKKAVELNNSYSSSSKSSGVSAGVNIGYGRKVLTDNASVSVSTSKSNMNSNGTTYQNGLFVNVDEEHNNTKNMTLSGFNQIGGKVTGNIQNLTIESKQNTSSTTGSTKGGSLSLSPNSNVISGVGINYANKDLESITKNTVIGNVEIGKASGAEINKDLASMTEVTKDRKFETNVNIESQTIKYALNPEAFKQDLEKAKNEITDIGNVVENTVNPKGKDKRNIFANLRAQRWNTSFYNVTGSRMEELSRQFKAGEIDEKELKEAARDLIKGYGKDIGIDFEVLYLDEATMPKDSKGSTGSSYILDKKNRKVLIPIDVNKLKDTGDLFGTLTEEVSHGKDALEGRQDLNVANDETNNEKGLESLGRPANDYVKNKLGNDNNSNISLTTDGKDYSNVDFGEKVGDSDFVLETVATTGTGMVTGISAPVVA